MREYIEHDGVITNEKNEVIHRFDVGVVRKTPPDAEKSVENMSFMFYDSNFNGNIADWDVSNVTNMSFMFYKSKFNGDISKWDVSNIEYMSYAFSECPLEENKPKWYKF